MFQRNQYELLDFGNGVKIERFGSQIVSRQSPSVDRFSLKHNPTDYRVDLRFETPLKNQSKSQLRWFGEEPDQWQLQHDGCQFELRQTQTGQVGVFPEQVVNWDWMRSNADVLQGKKAINLFAYTGGSTMALAKTGAEVVHVDSASSVVNWARKNADQSGLNDLPIRWIVDDAMKFLKRELKRGNRYDILVADPPSFGRGTKKNETWKIERDLPEFLATAAQLCPDPTMLILSAHTPSIGSAKLLELIRHNFPKVSRRQIEAFSLMLLTNENRRLPSGQCARFVIGQ